MATKQQIQTGVELPDEQQAVVRGLLAGDSLAAAAESAGVSESAVRYWLEQGKRGVAQYAQFADAVEILKSRNASGLKGEIARIAAGGHVRRKRTIKRQRLLCYFRLDPETGRELNPDGSTPRGSAAPIEGLYPGEEPPGIAGRDFRRRWLMLPVEEIETTEVVPPDWRAYFALLEHQTRGKGEEGGTVIDITPEDVSDDEEELSRQMMGLLNA